MQFYATFSHMVVTWKNTPCLSVRSVTGHTRAGSKGQTHLFDAPRWCWYGHGSNCTVFHLKGETHPQYSDIREFLVIKHCVNLDGRLCALISYGSAHPVIDLFCMLDPGLHTEERFLSKHHKELSDDDPTWWAWHTVSDWVKPPNRYIGWLINGYTLSPCCHNYITIRFHYPRMSTQSSSIQTPRNEKSLEEAIKTWSKHRWIPLIA